MLQDNTLRFKHKETGEDTDMKSKRLMDKPEMYALVFDAGDEVVTQMTDFARQQELSASQFTGLGAFSDVVLGFFNFEKKDYDRTVINEQVEVVSLIGDVTLDNGNPKLHPHVVVARHDGTAHGGHLLQAHVRPTLEVVITETPAHLRRKIDPKTGLPLIDPAL